MRYLLFICISLLFISCSQQKEKSSEKFLLTGKTKDINNGEILFLTEAFTHKVLDSVYVDNNLFCFRTELPYEPINCIVRTRYFDDYKLVWLENTHISFDASKTSFGKAKIGGSKTQKLAEELRNDLKKKHHSQRQNLEIEFIKEHPNSPLSTQLLSIYAYKWDRDVTAQLYTKLSAKNKNSYYGKSVLSFLNKDNKEDVLSHNHR